MKVSVVIPNYNHGAFVGIAVRSALNQTLSPHEIIAVDDGSRDSSREMLRSFGDKIRLICQDNHGLSGARNTGIQAATGDWIGLLDADDEWRPEFLEEMAGMAAVYPNAAVLYCCAQAMDLSGKDLPQVFGGPVVRPEEFYWTLLRTSFLIPSCVVLRRSMAVVEGMFNPAFFSCEDYDLWLRLAPRYQFVGTDRRLVRYRQHPMTLSADRPKMRHALEAVIKERFGPDDGLCSGWSKEKRRAYGGLCRFHVLSFLRQDDCPTAIAYLQRGVEIDPALALDVGWFYDMALGSQPSGYRGSLQMLDLEHNIRVVERLLDNAFGPTPIPELESVRRQLLGTANLALGLVAYNSGRPALSRRYLMRALFFRPALWRNRLAVGNTVKSLIGQSAIRGLRRLKGCALRTPKELFG
jgi:glycosyltransferase involved in cell wall biosynthesis